ncbi:cysteine desulfurase family protein [Clostridium formicaceticum]|uniref:cysteine desulfurase n=1 Tax=Clostridium formicaceticum TaxID=1497 RepID=A0AAC9RP61_9CLOT|nr:cysteine desulfurase family protein [Clostridium formicaceticum]AOY78078.1 cysteine desulfurase NifS [Clostridium formicaceticum]ARE88720.1 Cysteine desulfurase [Clostridium formicaceticum]
MIYLDYNATTPIDKEVADAMLPYLYGGFGNPSSTHELGVTAKKAVEYARKQVAMILNCSPEEIIFTSGGSESNNTVIKGVAFTYKNQGNHIITTQVEHPAIINPCKFLEKLGYEVTYLPVDKYGMVNPLDVEKAVTDKTILITIMHSNNEVGTIQPIEEIAEVCKKYNILFHTDASQSIGKVPVDVKSLGVDFLTVAGHKLYAPKGIGALYIRDGINIEPLIHGAGHEGGKRAGTENIILDVALGKACEIAMENLKESRIKELTEYFYKKLKENFDKKIHLNGHPEKRLPNTLNVSFIGYNGHEVLRNLNETAASTGSACHSGLTTISPVLEAMGVSEEIGRGAVRFSLGSYTTKEEIDTVIENLYEIL